MLLANIADMNVKELYILFVSDSPNNLFDIKMMSKACYEE